MKKIDLLIVISSFIIAGIIFTAKNKKFANTAVKNSDPKLQVTLVVITAGTNKRRLETQGHGLIGARKQILIPC